MTTKYPVAIDTVVELPKMVNGVTNFNADDFNRLRDAIVAVEAELGVKPSGIYSTVRSRLSAVETVVTNLQSGVVTFSGDVNSPSAGIQKVTGLQGIPVDSTQPDDGYVLTYDLTSNTWKPAQATGGTGGSASVSGDIAKSVGTDIDRVRGIRGVPISGSDGNPAVIGSTPVFNAVGGDSYKLKKPSPAGWFDVTDYGATGAGFPTDDSAAIQAAINAMSASNSYVGETLYFPPKTDGTQAIYYCANDIHLNKQVIVRGVSGGNSFSLAKLQFAAGKQLIVWHQGSPYGNTSSQGSQIRDLEFTTTKVAVSIWLPNNSYSVGDKVMLTDTNWVYLECIKSGTSGSVEPVNTIGNEGDYSFPFQANTAYTYGQLVRGTTDGNAVAADGSNLITDRLFMCLVDGTTGSLQPSWTGGIGTNTISGSVTFYSVDATAPTGTQPVFLPDNTVVWAQKIHACIWERARTHIENVHVDNATNAGVMIRAYSGTIPAQNANGWIMTRVFSSSCGIGLAACSGDANVGVATGCDVQNAGYGLPGNGGIGIYDACFLGSTWIGCQVANDPTVGGGPSIKQVQGAAQSIFLGCYTEGYGDPTDPRIKASFIAPAVVIGGAYGSLIEDNSTATQIFNGLSGNGVKELWARHTGNDGKQLYGYMGRLDGESVFSWSGGDDTYETSISRTDNLAGFPAKWWAVGQKAVLANKSFAFPVIGATFPGGASITDPGAFWVTQPRIHIGAAYGASEAPRSIGFGSDIPSSIDPTGYYQLGSIVYNNNPSPGTAPVMWVCIVAGTPGTWVPIPSGTNLQTTIAMADTNQAVSDVQAVSTIIRTTGALTANRTLTLPSPSSDAVGYQKTIINNCSGSFSIIVSTGSGTTVSITNGQTVIVGVDTTGVFTLSNSNVSGDIAKSAEADIDRVRGIRGVSISGSDGVPSVRGSSLVFTGTNYERKKPSPAGWYDVTDYADGATIWDGTTDALPAIKNAIKAMAGTYYGGTLFFPPALDGSSANYRVSSDIHITRPIKVCGVSGGSGNGIVRITFDPGAQFVIWSTGGPTELGVGSGADSSIEDIDIWTNPITTLNWTPLTTYVVGDKRLLFDENSVYLECIQSGITSPGTAPIRTYQVVASGPTYVDKTTAAGDATDADFEPFAAGSVVGDYVLFGASFRFESITFDYANGTAGVFDVGGSITWEYYATDGTWKSLPSIVDNTSGFTAAVGDSKTVSWDMTNTHDWYHFSPISSDETDLYYIRARITTANYTTRPILDQVYVGTLGGISWEPDFSSDFVEGATYTYGNIVRGHHLGNLITSRVYLVTSPYAGTAAVSGPEPAWDGNELVGTTFISGGLTFESINSNLSWIIDGSCVWAVKVHAGILAKARCTVDRVSIWNTTNAGFFCRANSSISSGNANHPEIRRCEFNQCGKGIMITGADANNALVTNCSIQSCGYHLRGQGGIGIHDSSFLNSTWIMCEIANATEYGGGPSIKRYGGAAKSIFVNCYSESYPTPETIEQQWDSSAEVIGGNYGAPHYFRISGGPMMLSHGNNFGCKNIVGTQITSGTTYNSFIADHGSASIHMPYGWSKTGEAQKNGILSTDPITYHPAGWWALGRTSYFYRTGIAFAGDTAKWPSNTDIENNFAVWNLQPRFYMGQPWNGDPPYLGFLSSSPETAEATSYHTAGSFVNNLTPGVGKPFGWVCTATGTPGTWAPVAGGANLQTTIAMSDANQTVSDVQAVSTIIRTTDALTANRTLTLPTPSSDATGYQRTIINDCSGAFYITVQIAAGTTVNVSNGQSAIVKVDTSGVVAISTGSSGAVDQTNPAQFVAGANNTVLTSNGTNGVWATIVDANVSATAAIAGTKISPNFGSQNVITSGAIEIGSAYATQGTIRLSSTASIYTGDGTAANDKPVFESNGTTCFFGANIASTKFTQNVGLYGSSAAAIGIGSSTYIYCVSEHIENWKPRWGNSAAASPYGSDGLVVSAMTDANYSAPGSEYKFRILKITATFTADRTISLPGVATDDVSYEKYIINASAGGFNLVVAATSGGGGTVTIANGKGAFVFVSTAGAVRMTADV